MVSIICGRWSLWSRYLGEYRNKGKKDECLRRFEYRTDRSLLVRTTSRELLVATILTAHWVEVLVTWLLWARLTRSMALVALTPWRLH